MKHATLVLALTLLSCALDDETEPAPPPPETTVIAAGHPWDDCDITYGHCADSLEVLQLALVSTSLTHVPAWAIACTGSAEVPNCEAQLAVVRAQLAVASHAILRAQEAVNRVQGHYVEPTVVAANALNLGAAPGIVAVGFAIQATAAYLRARIWLAFAYTRMGQVVAALNSADIAAGNSPTLVAVARPRLRDLGLTAVLIMITTLPQYQTCVETQLGGIVVAALQNIAAGAAPGGGGGGGGGGAARMATGVQGGGFESTTVAHGDEPAFDVAFGPTNPMFHMPDVVIDYGTTYAGPAYQTVSTVDGWRSSRTAWVWYRLPEGLVLPEIRDVDDEPWIPAGTPICAGGGGPATVTYAPSTGCALVYGYFHSLFTVPDVGGDPTACVYVPPTNNGPPQPGFSGILRPGEGTGCPLTLQTTGTPATIGQQATYGATVLVADGPYATSPTGFRSRMHISLTAPLEGPPPDSCWRTWSSIAQQWQYDATLPGCEPHGPPDGPP